MSGELPGRRLDISTRTPRVGSDRNILFDGTLFVNILCYEFDLPPAHLKSAPEKQRFPARTSFVSHVCLLFALDYSAKNPSGSYVGFAPTCSIFVWYLFPR